MVNFEFYGGYFEILAAILENKMFVAVLCDSTGFHDPENMGIGIRIALLLGASPTKFLLFYVTFYLTTIFEITGPLMILLDSLTLDA